MSSKLLELKNLDLDINYAGIKPLIDGGIAIVEVDRKAKSTKKVLNYIIHIKMFKLLKESIVMGHI